LGDWTPALQSRGESVGNSRGGYVDKAAAEYVDRVVIAFASSDYGAEVDKRP
jgi:hypothetical protein